MGIESVPFLSIFANPILKNRTNKGKDENKFYKIVQKQSPTGIVPGTVIFTGCVAVLSNLGTMVMIQDSVEGVKQGFNYHRAAV